MLDSVRLFKVGQKTNAVKQNPVAFKGSELPQSLQLAKADSFKKRLIRNCGIDCATEDDGSGDW